MFLYIYFNYLLVELANEIQSHPDRHYDASRNRACSSQLGQTIVCSCLPHGVTSRLGLSPRPGGTLVLVPKMLLGTWKQEWRAVGIRCDLDLYIQHRQFKQDFLTYQRFRNLVLERVSGEGRQAVMRLSAGQRPHCIIVVTTIGSYWSKMLSRAQTWRPLRQSGYQKDDLSFGDRTDGLAWARIVQDEAHVSQQGSTRLPKIMVSLAANGWIRPNFVPITATPIYRRGPSDMQHMVNFINMMSDDIHTHSECSPFAESAAFERLCQEWWRMRVAQQRGDTETVDVRTIVSRVGHLYSAYVLQRRNDSVQNGKPLVSIPPLEMYDVLCPSAHDQDRMAIRHVESYLHKTRLASHDPDKDIGLKELLEISSRARILADVPALAQVVSKHALTMKHIQEQGWHEAPAESPFAEKLQVLEASSGKLLTLKKIISSLGTTSLLQPEKLVVVSEFPVVCLIVLLVCRYCLVVPRSLRCLADLRQSCMAMGVECKWIHSMTPGSERDGILARFQEDREVEEAEVPIRVVVGTTRILGVGLTLHKAFRLVLMEPSYSLGAEMQLAKRIHRIGVATDRCWFYRLHNPMSSLERSIMDDSKTQQRYQRAIERFYSSHAPPRTVLEPSTLSELQEFAVVGEDDEGAREVISDDDEELHGS